MTEQQSQLIAAKCAVMAALERLAKEHKNKFAHYDFTSVDDFKDAARPLMASNGLAVNTTQVCFDFVEMEDDKGKKRQVARYDFQMTLCHVSGEKDAPEIMTVCLPYTGAQTSGAARSYAIKEWIKSTFLSSAGDMQEEADLLEQSREGLRLSKADARPMFQELEKGLREAASGRDHDALAKWWHDNKERIDSLPKDWFLNLKSEYGDRWKELKAQADLDRMSEEELDRLALERHPINAG